MENTTAGKVALQQGMREREDGVKEEEGKERSSHRLSIRDYHSSMQCGIWPRPLKTRPERLYHSFVGGRMRTEAISAHVDQLSTMATFQHFFLLFYTTNFFFTVTILSINMNILMNFLQSVCIVWELQAIERWYVCICIYYIKVFCGYIDLRGGTV